MSKYVKLTKKFRKDMEDISNAYRKMYNAFNYTNPSPYHFLDKKCMCKVCLSSYDDIYTPRFVQPRLK